MWAVSEVPIGQLPSPPPARSSDQKADGSSLRVWTIRADATPPSQERRFPELFLGICRLSTAPDYDPNQDVTTITVTTGSADVFVGQHTRGSFCPYGQDDPVGSLYHFTADLSSGTVCVRPIIPDVAARSPPPNESPMGHDGEGNR